MTYPKIKANTQSLHTFKEGEEVFIQRKHEEEKDGQKVTIYFIRRVKDWLNGKAVEEDFEMPIKK